MYLGIFTRKLNNISAHPCPLWADHDRTFQWRRGKLVFHDDSSCSPPALPLPCRISTLKIYQGNVLQAFHEFVDSYAYENDAIAKEAPKELDDAAKAAWVEQNKRKLFLGRFATLNLQRAFEAVTTPKERFTLTFKNLVTKLSEHFKTGSNTTLANFEFRKLHQKSDESFDALAIRVKHDARKCDFPCTDAQCTVRDTLARDQIITGVFSDEIR